MTKRPDQHNIDPEEAGTTDHKFRRNEEDPPRETPEDTPGDAPPGPPTPQERLERRRKQAEADRAQELDRAREHVDDA